MSPATQSQAALTELREEVIFESNVADKYIVTQDAEVPVIRIKKDGYSLSNVKAMARRGVMWLGQTCNLRCYFCYFIDKIADPRHPEHGFMSLDKAKAICTGLVEQYGDSSIDIQGGEPSIAPYIYDLIRHCRDIGLKPTLITNALVYDKPANCQKLLDAGVFDLLISVHGLGEVYDNIVKIPGASKRQQKGIENLKAAGVPFRFNTTLCKEVLPHLEALADHAVASGARAFNFIAFNPFIDQKDRRTIEAIPKYTDQAAMLMPVLDKLEAHGIEANVRYMPFCVFPEKYRKFVQNFPQIIYDLHEWETAGELWSGGTDNRLTAKPVPPFVDIDQRIDWQRQQIKTVAPDENLGITDMLETPGLTETEKQFRTYRIMQTRLMHPYSKGDPCQSCDVRGLCDGFHKEYGQYLGFDEATPIKIGGPTSDARFYQRHQLKVVEDDEADWVFAGLDV